MAQERSREASDGVGARRPGARRPTPSRARGKDGIKRPKARSGAYKPAGAVRVVSEARQRAEPLMKAEFRPPELSFGSGHCERSGLAEFGFVKNLACGAASCQPSKLQTLLFALATLRLICVLCGARSSSSSLFVVDLHLRSLSLSLHSLDQPPHYLLTTRREFPNRLTTLATTLHERTPSRNFPSPSLTSLTMKFSLALLVAAIAVTVSALPVAPEASSEVSTFPSAARASVATVWAKTSSSLAKPSGVSILWALH